MSAPPVSEARDGLSAIAKLMELPEGGKTLAELLHETPLNLGVLAKMQKKAVRRDE